MIKTGGDGMYYEKQADEEGHLLFTRYTKEHCPLYSENPHYHASIEIYLVASGEFPVSIGGERRILQAGEIAFVDGHTPHFCGILNPDPDFEVFVIVASKRYFDEKDAKTDTIAVFSKSSEKRTEIIDFVRSMYLLQQEMNHKMRLGFVNLLLGMLQKECSTDAVPRKEKTNLTVEIMRFIDTEYNTPIDLDTLSKKFGYEPTYISRVFNKYAGVNLHQYINQARYRATKKMLSECPTLTVANAALACGFQSMKTYYRVAKQLQNSNKYKF